MTKYAEQENDRIKNGGKGKGKGKAYLYSVFRETSTQFMGIKCPYFQSCIFHPCDFVRHFRVPVFPVLHFQRPMYNRRSLSVQGLRPFHSWARLQTYSTLITVFKK